MVHNGTVNGEMLRVGRVGRNFKANVLKERERINFSTYDIPKEGQVTSITVIGQRW